MKPNPPPRWTELFKDKYELADYIGVVTQSQGEIFDAFYNEYDALLKITQEQEQRILELEATDLKVCDLLTENEDLRDENKRVTRLCRDKFGPAGLKHVHEIMEERDLLREENKKLRSEVEDQYKIGMQIQGRLEIAVSALEKLNERVGSCAFSNTDLWGNVMEFVYRSTREALKQIKGKNEHNS